MSFAETQTFLDAIIRNALVVEMARAVARSRRVPTDDLEAADNLNTLGGMFGLSVPYYLTRTKLKNIEAIAPALVTLAVQVQFIIRFHIDGPTNWRELTNIKVKNTGWTLETVEEVYALIDKVAKVYHLGWDNLPKDGYRVVNDVDMRAFRMAASKFRIGHCLFVPDINTIYETSIPRKREILFGGIDIENFFGKGIDCVSVHDTTLWNHMCEPKIIMAV